MRIRTRMSCKTIQDRHASRYMVRLRHKASVSALDTDHLEGRESLWSRRRHVKPRYPRHTKSVAIMR